jgi:hypothetical protein
MSSLLDGYFARRDTICEAAFGDPNDRGLGVHTGKKMAVLMGLIEVRPSERTS